MTSYFEYHVNLSDGQKRKLAAAIKKSSPVTLRLGKNELRGKDELMLTQTQIKIIQKAIQNRTGVEIAISKNQIRKAVKHGGSLFSSPPALGAKVLPLATKFIPKVAAPLATGAVSALRSLGVDKLFGSGQVGGFLIPDSNVQLLIQYKNLLTKKQKEDIVNALQNGEQVIVEPSQKQLGGMLGTVLASIGIPMLLKALTEGSGLQVPRKAAAGLQVSAKPALYPYYPPPFYGNWEGSGKSKKRLRTSSRAEFAVQSDSVGWGDSVRRRPQWKDIPLSNVDLMNWVRFWGIPDFEGIFSRHSKDHLHKTGNSIINLDDGIGPGSHWVATNIKGKRVFYFDSFSIHPLVEFLEYTKGIGKEIVYNGGHPIQDILSVRCSYYCLYFLKEIQSKSNQIKSFYDVLKVFSLKDSQKNERLIKQYFLKQIR